MRAWQTVRALDRKYSNRSGAFLRVLHVFAMVAVVLY